MTDEYKLVYLIVAIAVIGACFTIIVGVVSACASASTTANTTSVQEEYKDVLATYKRGLGLDKNLTLREGKDGGVVLLLGKEQMADFTNRESLNGSKNNLTSVLDKVLYWNLTQQ